MKNPEQNAEETDPKKMEVLKRKCGDYPIQACYLLTLNIPKGYAK